MFGKKVNFSQCPRYDGFHDSIKRLTHLEKNVNTLVDNQSELNTSLREHMNEEMSHHIKTSDNVALLAKTVSELVDDSKAHRLEREQAEKSEKAELSKAIKLQQRKDDLKWKVLGSALTAITLGIGYWLFDILSNLEKVNSVIHG